MHIIYVPYMYTYVHMHTVYTYKHKFSGMWNELFGRHIHLVPHYFTNDEKSF